MPNCERATRTYGIPQELLVSPGVHAFKWDEWRGLGAKTDSPTAKAACGEGHYL